MRHVVVQWLSWRDRPPLSEMLAVPIGATQVETAPVDVRPRYGSAELGHVVAGSISPVSLRF